MGDAPSGTFGMIVGLFLFFAAVLWFLLPFAVFGTKAQLDELKAIKKRRLRHSCIK